MRRILPEGWAKFTSTPAPNAPAGEHGAHWWLPVRSNSTLSSVKGFPTYNARVAEQPGLMWASGYQGQYVVSIPSQDLVVVRIGLTADRDTFNLNGLLVEIMDALKE